MAVAERQLSTLTAKLSEDDWPNSSTPTSRSAWRRFSESTRIVNDIGNIGRGELRLRKEDQDTDMKSTPTSGRPRFGFQCLYKYKPAGMLRASGTRMCDASVVVDPEKQEAVTLKCGPFEACFVVQDRANICTRLDTTFSLKLYIPAKRRRDRGGAASSTPPRVARLHNPLVDPYQPTSPRYTNKRLADIVSLALHGNSGNYP